MSNDIIDVIPNSYRSKKHLPRASQAKRFGNFIIDRIMIYIFSFGAGGLIGVYLVSVDSEYLYLLEQKNNLTVTILDYLLGAILTLAYYTLCEYYLKGKTIGKYVTKTRAVRDDLNGELTLGNAFKRSASRIVPFEPFSFLGDNGQSGWHDKWTDTRVVDETAAENGGW